MEKRTLLAVLLSIGVIVIFSLVQGMYYGAQEYVPAEPVTVAAPEPVATSQPSSGVQPSSAVQPESVQGTFPVLQQDASRQPFENLVEIDDPGVLRPVVVETNLLRVTLSNVGGDIISFKLLEHFDKDEPVDMVLSGTAEPHAFSIGFGSREDVLLGRINPVKSNFRVEQPTPYTVIFTREFTMGTGDSSGINSGGTSSGGGNSGGRFTLTKRYDFRPNEYMFELTVIMDGGSSFRNFDFHGAAYTLIFGPQIGPRFEKLDQRAELRQYLTYNKNKVRQEKINTQAKEVPEWAAIVGKYFTMIAIPDMRQFDVFFSDQREEGIPSASRMLLTRPGVVNSSRVEDKYHFYMGPKKQEILNTYYNGSNEFAIHSYQLADAAKAQTFMSIPPLENFLKAIMMFLYRIIPNYGIAIILLTVLVKAVMFPLTRKSSESTLRMQTLAPKIKEIQEKHKDNKQKMNLEMAELYKKEGYNPLSGCLPMIIQLPIFFAMYNLFNTHFDLRGAMFIPGWIPDLSLPESIFNFAPIQLPLLGWSDIRLLPFIYVGSQLLYGKVTQTPDQKGNQQMKLMLFAMPVVFFFILYDVPSGLLIYWIMSNVLTMVQQIIINKYIAKKKAAMKEPEPVIAPRKKKKK